MTERPILFSGPMVRAILDGRKTQTRLAMKLSFVVDKKTPKDVAATIKQYGELDEAPPYVEGDRLWVRESFTIYGHDCPTGPQIVYRADDDDFMPDGPQWEPFRWKRSIHMPRKYCRLLLDVKAVRVERLNDISEKDCLAEGCIDKGDSAGDQFAELWESINGKRGCGWKENPWVWVIEFERTGAER